MAFWSESTSSLLRGLRTRLLFFLSDHVLLIRSILGLLVPGLNSISTTFSMLSAEPQPWYDVVKWLCKSLWMSQIFFWAFIAVMLSESSQLSKQFDASTNRLLPFLVPFWARLSTLTGALRYSIASVYMLGLFFMTLGVLGSHLVI